MLCAKFLCCVLNENFVCWWSTVDLHPGAVVALFQLMRSSANPLTSHQKTNHNYEPSYDTQRSTAPGAEVVTVPLKNKILLGLLNFTTLNRARPGIFVAPYLLMRGWNESQIGWLYFLNCILSLFVQTPAGSLADSTSYKRSMIAFSNLLIASMCLVLIYFSHIWIAVVVSLAFLGVGYTIAYPAVYSMTLGIVGAEGIMEQVPINETSIHAGNAFFAIFSGFVVYYMDEGDTIFYICIAMAIITVLLLGLFDPNSISTDRARGITPLPSSSTSASSTTSLPTSSLSSAPTEPAVEPIPLSHVMFNPKVIIFFISIMFFHLSNASMLPLLAQILFVKGDHGFEFSCLCVAVAQLTMILSASFAGYYVRYIGTKQLFLLSFVFLPLRGITLMILLWNPDPDPFVLVSTQILDGAAGGLFGVISVLIAENLSRFDTLIPLRSLSLPHSLSLYLSPEGQVTLV
jgi:MFS family permease